MAKLSIGASLLCTSQALADEDKRKVGLLGGGGRSLLVRMLIGGGAAAAGAGPTATASASASAPGSSPDSLADQWVRFLMSEQQQQQQQQEGGGGGQSLPLPPLSPSLPPAGADRPLLSLSDASSLGSSGGGAPAARSTLVS